MVKVIDLSPNVQYKKSQKALLQEMCRDIYSKLEPLGIKKGNTVVAEIDGSEISEIYFIEKKRDSKGNFIDVNGNSVCYNISVVFEKDNSGRFTGNYEIFDTKRETLLDESRELEKILDYAKIPKKEEVSYDMKQIEKYIISLDDAVKRGLKNIDIGGTPAKVLELNKIGNALNKGVKPEQLVYILDPFDLSRAERKLIFGNYSIKGLKFNVDVPSTDLSSEYVDGPDSYEIISLMNRFKPKILGNLVNKYRGIDKNALENRYEELKDKITKLSEISANLREFMNRLIILLSPEPIEIMPLEKIFSENKEIVYNLLDKIGDINIRAICPRCKQFNEMSLKQETPCCGVSSNEIIESGKYIPEQGLFPVLTTLCGYIPELSDGLEYIEPAAKILEKLGVEPLFIVDDQENQLTMFESYMLKGLIK